MSHTARRSFAILLTLASLSLPLAAQARREPAERAAPAFLSGISELWNRLTAPLSILWSGDTDSGPAGTESTPAVQPQSPPPPDLDGRSVIDPLG